MSANAPERVGYLGPCAACGTDLYRAAPPSAIEAWGADGSAYWLCRRAECALEFLIDEEQGTPPACSAVPEVSAQPDRLRGELAWREARRGALNIDAGIRALEMVVIHGDRTDAPGGWTHWHTDYRLQEGGGLEIGVFSVKSQADYIVGPDYCTCEHFMRRCQSVGAVCKHSAWAFPGGMPRAGIAVRDPKSAAEQDRAQAGLAATFGG